MVYKDTAARHAADIDINISTFLTTSSDLGYIYTVAQMYNISRMRINHSLVLSKTSLSNHMFIALARVAVYSVQACRTASMSQYTNHYTWQTFSVSCW